MGFYKFCRFGHVSRDCPQGTSLLCFHFNQVGHKNSDSPELVKGAVTAPAPATMRITNGREGKVDVPVVRSQALQSHAKEIQVPSFEVVGMCCIHFLHALIN